MKTQPPKSPTKINYQVQQAIEQMVSTLPKGTDLGLCDVISAMYSGYFVESGGGVMPAIDQYLRGWIPEESERAARSRRAAKAITYGQYNLNELIAEMKRIVTQSSQWQPTIVQGYRLKSVDMTSYKRSKVKTLKSKGYDSNAQRAMPAVPFGIMGTTGEVNGQRVALLEMLICGDINQNQPAEEMKKVYSQVAQQLAANELAVFDAGFSLIEAVVQGIDHCVVRLATNCTFGQSPGKIPVRTSNKGPEPSRHQAEIVRPLTRRHGGKELAATPADETRICFDEAGEEIRIEVWQRVYFLERHLDRVADETLKKTLRKKPLQVVVIHHPDFIDPLVLGTPLLSLEPQAMMMIYPQRWPIEGIPQTGKYLLSGGGGRHFVHHPTAITRLPALTMIFGSLFKYLAAIMPPIRTGFWDRVVKPTYGRLMRYLKKVGLPISSQLSKKASVTAHLPPGYDAIRLSRA